MTLLGGNVIGGGTKCIIHEGANLGFSGITVSLKPGFHAKSESTFEAKPITCFELENLLSKSETSNSGFESTKTDIIISNPLDPLNKITHKFNILNFLKIDVKIISEDVKGKKLEVLFYDEINEIYTVSVYNLNSRKRILYFTSLSGIHQLFDISELEAGEYGVEIKTSSGVYAAKKIYNFK